MGLQKYRFDRAEEPARNGAVPVYADWQHGPSLSGVRNCPVTLSGSDATDRRTVYVTSEEQVYAGAWDAQCRVGGRTCKGTLAIYEDGFVMHRRPA